MTGKAIFSIFNSELTGDDSSKFSLFIKAHEVKEVAKILEHVLTLSKVQRRRWLKDNGEFMHSAFENLVDNSNQLFQDIVFDDETLELSQELIVNLRDTVYLIESITNDHRNLAS